MQRCCAVNVKRVQVASTKGFGCHGPQFVECPDLLFVVEKYNTAVCAFPRFNMPIDERAFRLCFHDSEVRADRWVASLFIVYESELYSRLFCTSIVCLFSSSFYIPTTIS